MYVYNRETGQNGAGPYRGAIPWRRAPFPARYYSPGTHPCPLDKRLPLYEKSGVADESVLIDYTPELRKEALEIVKHYKMGPIFTPPVESKAEGPWVACWSRSLSARLDPAAVLIDPDTGVVYVGSSRGAIGMGLVPSGTRSDVGYISGRAPGAQGQLTVQGLPLLKPPYSQISAIDLKTGTLLWQVPHGDTPDNVRNNPALKGVNIPRTGHGGAAITLVTKTLVVAGEKGTITQADGRMGVQRVGPTIRAIGEATLKARCTCRHKPRAVP